jgi:hypothetical protein
MDYIADDDPRPSDPLDFYTSDLLRGLLGRFHDKVKDSALLIERYRGRFPDRVQPNTPWRRLAAPGSLAGVGQHGFLGTSPRPRLATATTSATFFPHCEQRIRFPTASSVGERSHSSSLRPSSFEPRRTNT